MRSTSKQRARSPLDWFSALIREPDKEQRRMMAVDMTAFRIILTICAGIIVCVGWSIEDRNSGYRVGMPSPRTYTARRVVRVEDVPATISARNQAADSIVNVRVLDATSARAVDERIADLKAARSAPFAASELRAIIDGLPDAVRDRVVDTAIEIAEGNMDKATDRLEQTDIIWRALRPLDIPQSEKNIVFQLVDSILEPTIHDDAAMTNRVRSEVVDRMPRVVREIPIGGVLISEGETVTQATADILAAQGYHAADTPWLRLAFVSVLAFLTCLWITWLGTKLDRPISRREWMFIGTVLVLGWTVQRAAAHFDGIDALPVLMVSGWMFLTMSPAFAFHVTLSGCAIGYMIAYGAMSSQIAVGFAVCLIASGASSMLVREAASRLMIWRGVVALGLWVMLATLLMRWGLGLAISIELMGRCLLLALLWASVVVALLPLWENMFDIISPLRLLELSHPSQPLLKRLQVEAPSTYHHTYTVATLAAEVADRLGMNSLLVRTGGYYHDIGKLKRPSYFVENQARGDNIHDRLAPDKSSGYILEHVTYGIDLANEAKLPEAIKSFIREHHGTTTNGFYFKAVELDKESGGDGSSVDRKLYTYPGPIPQSEETALLMLADSIEAASKSDKTALASNEEIKKLVDRVVDSKISAGQLADVNFTMKDITNIKRKFTEVLIAMYHDRELGEQEKAADAPAPAEKQVKMSSDVIRKFVDDAVDSKSAASRLADAGLTAKDIATIKQRFNAALASMFQDREQKEQEDTKR